MCFCQVTFHCCLECEKAKKREKITKKSIKNSVFTDLYYKKSLKKAIFLCKNAKN